jgi:tetratricopeptide (TPR) repeat protein
VPRLVRLLPLAVAVAREEQKPILVCINMDGEIASEHYAGVRYRSPEIAALYEPYVLVIASTYRHTPRDHDEQGRRIPCPRFGGVTCGEHIAIEPGIFEKYCDGQRIAPRHILVELDGSETFDVYYRNDTASVFESIRRGAEGRPPPKVVVRGDRPVVERVASRHVADRAAVESAYQKGDPALRRALLEAAVKSGQSAQLDLLRQAVFGFDPDLSKVAREALTKVDTPDATTLVADALRVPMDTAERDALIATLERLGSGSTLARWLAVVHKGLAKPSGTLDVRRWEESGATKAADDPSGGDRPAHLEALAKAARERPDDPTPRLDLAEGSLIFSLEAAEAYPTDARRARLLARAMLDDARRMVGEAEALGAKGWRVDALAALASYYAGEREPAYVRAEAAAREIPPGDGSWTSMATLTVFGEGRFKAIKRAVKEKLDFPPQWLTDVHAAYAVLLRHPLGTEGQVLWHHDLLDWLGAYDQSAEILKRGLSRFAASAALHERYRAQVLKTRGPGGLVPAYDALLREPSAPPVLAWYAGAAAAAAADVVRKAGRLEEALGFYERAVLRFDEARAADAALAPVSQHAASHAHASRARVLYQLGKDADALQALLLSFSTSPASAGSRDGAGITPAETGQMLLARLRAARDEPRVAQLEAALGSLDPELLRPDRE